MCIRDSLGSATATRTRACRKALGAPRPRTPPPESKRGGPSRAATRTGRRLVRTRGAFNRNTRRVVRALVFFRRAAASRNSGANWEKRFSKVTYRLLLWRRAHDAPKALYRKSSARKRPRGANYTFSRLATLPASLLFFLRFLFTRRGPMFTGRGAGAVGCFSFRITKPDENGVARAFAERVRGGPWMDLYGGSNARVTPPRRAP